MDLMVNPVITGFRQDVDGTIKELKLGEEKQDAWANIAEQGASAKLDNNKTKTIDVSTYTEPVEVLPTSGKDGMKKATITLSNIPSPSPATGVTLYAWKTEGIDFVLFTLSESPVVGDNLYKGDRDNTLSTPTDKYVISEVGEDDISFVNSDVTYVATRYSTGDLTYPKSSS